MERVTGIGGLFFRRARPGGKSDRALGDGRDGLLTGMTPACPASHGRKRCPLPSTACVGRLSAFDVSDVNDASDPHSINYAHSSPRLSHSMAAYCKAILPFMPCGVVVNYRWRASERYNVTDFIIAQTWMETQSAASFRDSAVAMARRNGLALVLSVNLFGAASSPGCEPRGKKCLMLPADVREWGRTFAAEPYACAVMLWHYEAPMWGRAVYQEQFRDIASVAAQRFAKPCRR